MNKNLPLLLVLSGLLLSGLAAGYYLFTSRIEQPGTAPLPPSVAGLSLRSTSIGRAAASEINRMHRQEFAMTTASVGIYGANQATIWAASAPTRFSAGRMLDLMVVRIDEGKSPFTPLGERKDGNTTIYELDGLGQKHFYFQSKQLLIWLAADFDLAEAALGETLEYYR
jgi:hypothetical protein